MGCLMVSDVIKIQYLTILVIIVAGSPNHHHLISHPTVIGSGGKPGSKSKKRPKSSISPNSPEVDLSGQVVRRKPSVKKNKKPTLEDGAMSLEATASLYSNAGLPQQPPAYEESIKNAVSLSSLHTLGLEPAYAYQALPGFQDSPPHSVSSPSPVKTRPSMPLSPTHMAAMRAATQKHAAAMQFEFPSDLSYMGYPQQQYYHYLTPPSESLQTPESFPTPSPESSSPCYWSSSSPHSNSDWSEGISSPNNNKQPDPIYI